MATATAWAWFCTPSLAKIRCLWFSTVLGLMPMAWAARRVVEPAPISPSTWISRWERSGRRSSRLTTRSAGTADPGLVGPGGEGVVVAGPQADDGQAGVALAEGGDETAGVPLFDVELEDHQVDVLLRGGGHQLGGGAGGGDDLEVGLAAQYLADAPADAHVDRRLRPPRQHDEGEVELVVHWSMVRVTPRAVVSSTVGSGSWAIGRER